MSEGGMGRLMPRLSTVVRSRAAQAKRLSRRLRLRYGGTERPRAMPRLVQIEASSRCNLRCRSCPRSGQESAGGHLRPDDLRRILDKLPAPPETVRLSGVGEPLLNPEFPDLVDVIAESGLTCDFITNGTLLDRARRDAILARECIRCVAISCDGARKETFEACRVGADFDLWVRQVGDFVAEARERRPHPIVTESSTVISTQNIGELHEILRLVAGLGFHEAVMLQPVPANDTAAAMCPSAEQLAAVRDARLRELGASLGLEVSVVLSRTTTSSETAPECVQPWEHMFIREGGNVEACCALFEPGEAAQMGNLFEQTFDEIWHGEAFQAFRRSSAAGTNRLCQRCPYY